MNKITNRGGTLVKVSTVSNSDPLWLDSDYSRAATLEARWSAMGVAEEERATLLPCAVWLSKFPGTQYPDTIMARLEKLRCHS